MSKASGGTRTVSSANAAASRTFAQSAIGGASGNSVQNEKKEMSYDDFDKIILPITNPIMDKFYSFKNFHSEEIRKYVDSKTEKGFYKKEEEEAKNGGYYYDTEDFAGVVAGKIYEFLYSKKLEELNIKLYHKKKK